MKEVVRKCCVCRQKKDRTELIKITREHKTKEIYVEGGNKIFGRSAYICANEDCVTKNIKTNSVFKALKISPKSLPKEVCEKLNRKIGAVLERTLSVKF